MFKTTEKIIAGGNVPEICERMVSNIDVTNDEMIRGLVKICQESEQFVKLSVENPEMAIAVIKTIAKANIVKRVVCKSLGFQND